MATDNEAMSTARAQVIAEALKAKPQIDAEMVRLLTREQKEDALVKAAAALAVMEELAKPSFTDEELHEIFKPIDAFYAVFGIRASGY